MCGSTTLPQNSHRHGCTGNKPQFEMADIFNRYLDRYLRSHKISYLQRKIIRAIQLCRTKALGGHRRECDLCDYVEQSYNSCGNRHCPKCQGALRAKWVDARLDELLPIPYYHVVFTLPHFLNNLTLYNKEIIYDIFFKAASQTLLAFGQDPKYLGAQLGLVAILHTWGQDLCYHVHLHFIVMGGGITFDGKGWRHLPYRKDFLFPVEAVSKVMKGKFRDMLDDAYRDGDLQFPDDLKCLTAPICFEHFKLDLMAQEWYCYSRKPFAGPEEVVKYVGRYTHRVAITNHRLLSIDNGQITFTYKDYRDNDKIKHRILPSNVFIQRFLLHVLPKGFRKIRYSGILANSIRKEKIATARKLLGVMAQELIDTNPVLSDIFGDKEDPDRCPLCKEGRMVTTEVIPRPSSYMQLDSS